MNNKLLLGIVIVLLGLGAGWYFFRGQSYQNVSQPSSQITTPTAATSESLGATGSSQILVAATVAYTDQGFSPATVTVKAGTTVTFVNQSSSSMWVASAVHPTHLLLPGFDQLTSVAAGGTYQYTFTKIGTWKYHNHLSPTSTGTVIVTQ